MLAQAFPVFPPFSFSSRYLYSTYLLLIVSSLALSTLPCVHLCPNKCALSLSMTLFNSFWFLCCSISSFGVSATSPKISLLLNMSPTLDIICIKCRNRHHMKNNIRHKGNNTNNTSVIIFFNWRTKTPSDVTLLGRTSREVFMMLVVVVLYSVVVLHFAVVVLHFIASYVMLFFSLLFYVIPHLSMDYRPVLHPFYTFSPVHRRVIRDTFIFNLSKIFFSQFYRERYGFEWAFFTQGVIYLMFLHRLFTWVCQDLPGSQQFFLPWRLQGFILILETDLRLAPSVCLVHSNPHYSYSEEFIFKFYQILSWVTCGESLIYLLLTRFELLSVVQSHM